MYTETPSSTEISIEENPGGTAVAEIQWRDVLQIIQPFIGSVTERIEEISEMAGYALSGVGKQFRPSLVALAGNAEYNEFPDDLVNIAVIVEMVHIATLVHDDIMDQASIRRGKTSLASRYGNQSAVLLGDCLFAHALKMASAFPSTEVCRTVASATKIVCSGEIRQTLTRSPQSVDRENYFRIVEMKTAELFALSCEMGLWVTNPSPEYRQILRRFGLALGTAYQIYDDCLDFFGKEPQTGKSLGKDIDQGKITLPVILALENATESDRVRILKMIKEWNPEKMNDFQDLLSKSNSQDASRDYVFEYIDKARECAGQLPDTICFKALDQLANFIRQQTVKLLKN